MHHVLRTDNAIKNRYYSTMRRMQRQSIRKKGPVREGKSIRVATINSSPPQTSASRGSAASMHQPPSQRSMAQPSAFQKLFNNGPADNDRVCIVVFLLRVMAIVI